MSEIYVNEGDTAMLIHPTYEGKVNSRWFFPEFWGANAKPVDSGGRGGAWFVDGGDVEVVLRQYRRGGLIGRIVKRQYLFISERHVRSFSEFRLLKHLADEGFPVSCPVAAWYQRNGSIYEAAIIVERIEGAKPLADKVELLQLRDWFVLGQVIRRFHDAGVRHADLNCFNVLVKDEAFFLIDFDKGKQEVGACVDQKWKSSNLQRLRRSLLKLSWHRVDLSLSECWGCLMQGYQKNLHPHA